MRAVLFDLDNTMYDVRQYFLPAFREVADFIADKYGLSESKMYDCLAALWKEKTSAYPFLFNDLAAKVGVSDRNAIAACVRIFNRHTCPLRPRSGLISVLRALKKQGYLLGVVTDGNIARQSRKIRVLGLKDFFDAVVYTKRIAEKPSAKPFLAAAKRLCINPREALYVGDNPIIDFKGAKECGMATARVLRGEFKDIKGNRYIDFQIEAFKELIGVTKKI